MPRSRSWFSCVLVTLAACSSGSLASDEWVLRGVPLTLDTVPTVLTVEPPFVRGAASSAVCVALDSATHVVELPHLVLRPRAPTDSAPSLLAMERGTADAITIAGDITAGSGSRTAIVTSSYASSHQLCLGQMRDSITQLRLWSSEPLAIGQVSLVTTQK